MSVNNLGRVVGGGMPAGKAGASRNEVGEVRTRKATPEELAGLDEAIRRKYGEKELERDKRKARAAMVVKDMMESSRRRKPDTGSREPDAEYSHGGRRRAWMGRGIGCRDTDAYKGIKAKPRQGRGEYVLLTE